MKRDMDLVRKLLLYFEEKESFADEEDTQIEGYTDDQVQHHLVLMAQAGLIDFEAFRSDSNPDRIIRVFPFQLNWAGHEFLDQARDETTWNKAKEKLGSVGGGLSLGLLQALLKSYLKEKLGLAG